MSYLVCVADYALIVPYIEHLSLVSLRFMDIQVDQVSENSTA